jgi:hypothetical protein
VPVGVASAFASVEASGSDFLLSSFRTTLSKAGRFASGWSFGPDGEDGSSKGRLVEGKVDGEADILVKSIFKVTRTLLIDSWLTSLTVHARRERRKR